MHKLSLADDEMISLLSEKNRAFKNNHKLVKKLASYMITNSFNGEIKTMNEKIKDQNRETRKK